MRKLTKQQQEAKVRLLEWLPKGTTLYTIVRRVSRSGMSRNIQLVYFHIVEGEGFYKDGTWQWMRPTEVHDRHPTHSIAQLLGKRTVKVNGHDTIQVNGCGMDMCWDLVAHQISHALHGETGALKQRPL